MVMADNDTAANKSIATMCRNTPVILVVLFQLIALVNGEDDSYDFKISKKEHHRYRNGDVVPLHVGPIFSIRTQLHLDSYDESFNLPICRQSNNGKKEGGGGNQGHEQQEGKRWIDKFLTLSPPTPMHKLSSSTMLRMNENKYNETLCEVDVTKYDSKSLKFLSINLIIIIGLLITYLLLHFSRQEWELR